MTATDASDIRVQTVAELQRLLATLPPDARVVHRFHGNGNYVQDDPLAVSYGPAATNGAELVVVLASEEDVNP